MQSKDAVWLISDKEAHAFDLVLGEREAGAQSHCKWNYECQPCPSLQQSVSTTKHSTVGIMCKTLEWGSGVEGHGAGGMADMATPHLMKNKIN